MTFTRDISPEKLNQVTKCNKSIDFAPSDQIPWKLAKTLRYIALKSLRLADYRTNDWAFNRGALWTEAIAWRIIDNRDTTSGVSVKPIIEIAACSSPAQTTWAWIWEIIVMCILIGMEPVCRKPVWRIQFVEKWGPVCRFFYKLDTTNWLGPVCRLSVCRIL